MRIDLGPPGSARRAARYQVVFAVGIGALRGEVGLLVPPKAAPVFLTLEFTVRLAEYSAVLGRMTPGGAIR